MPPELETPRLRLRMFTAADLDAYHQRVYGGADVMRYMPGGRPRSRDDTERVLNYFIEYWNDHPLGVWAVIEKGSEEFIGHAGLLYFENQPEDVEVIYALGKAWWGQGYASEAARTCLRYGFETARLNRIYALAFPDNKASQRVMQKIGMRCEGLTSRHHNAELVCYSIVQDEFEIS